MYDQREEAYTPNLRGGIIGSAQVSPPNREPGILELVGLSHKEIAVLEESLDHLTAKLSSILKPEQPRVARNRDLNPEVHAPMRNDMLGAVMRIENLRDRVMDLIDRVDF